MPLPFKFDFKNPDYNKVLDWRLERINRIRNNSHILPKLKAYYKQNPVQFIIDWGNTFDPRNPDIGLPSSIPFLLFPKQEDALLWFVDNWKSRKPCLLDKSRDMGVSWMFIGIACAICLFNEGIVAGFGSRKEEYVDKSDEPKSLFYKGREFLKALPKEFQCGWNVNKHAPFMRIIFPETNSKITGEAGDNIGRGARTTFYFVDEAAWLLRPKLVEASLSQTTNCRVDISTPRGMNNPFAQKRFSGKIPVYSIHWSDDPRKDAEWYRKQCEEIDDPLIIAQELDLDYSASIEGVLIPSKWVHAAIDAHLTLNVTPTGIRKLGLDVADEGIDLNAECGRHGILIDHVRSWRGKNSDLFETAVKAANTCDLFDYEYLLYDADGMGAAIRGDARIINEAREKEEERIIEFVPFRGSGEVVNPEEEVFKRKPGTKFENKKGRMNKDFLGNRKAQGWWHLRRLFQNTHRAVVEKQAFDPDLIISISSSAPEHRKLVTELSQVTYQQNEVGKIFIDKAPKGMRSPNHADAAMMVFAPEEIRRSVFNAA